MAAITASMVAELRGKTDAPMMECKKALTEANGDMEAAVDWLRKKGLSAAAKKAGRNRWSGLEIQADAVEPLLAAPAGGAIAARAQQGHVNLFSSDDSARRALLESPLPRLSPDH